MDGNGRWAKKRGLPRNIGHKQGATAFRNIVRHAEKKGIRHLSVYAFSTENWRRPPDEVNAIMDLFRSFLEEADRYEKENVRLRFLGDRAPLADDIRRRMDRIERLSADRDGMNLNIAINYGGRSEILTAVGEFARRCVSGEITDAQHALSEEQFSSLLYTAGQPDVDLVIRTSGEMRISNFLLWQSAYAEYIFTDVLWPDYSPAHFDSDLREYANRNRRMGGI